MQQEIFEVKRERFSLLDDNLYLLQGDFPKEYETEAYLDDKPLETQMEIWENTSALERFQDLDLKKSEKVTVKVFLPENLGKGKKLKIYAVSPDEKIKWFSIGAAELDKRRGAPCYYIEEEKADAKNCSLRVRGWTAFREPVDLRVYDESGKAISCDIQWSNRVDVAAMFTETEISAKCGFFLELHEIQTGLVYLVFRSEGKKSVYPIHMNPLMVWKRRAWKYAVKGTRYLRSHGARALAGKIFGKVKTIKSQPVVYQKWIERHLPSQAELQKQREMHFEYNPKISIVVPLYKTPENYLKKLVESVKAQTYTNWELCLSDGSGTDSSIRGILQDMQEKDGRIRVLYHEEPLGLSENTNAAIEAAKGDFIAFADHDDELTANALFECVKALNHNQDIHIIYSDEDKMSMDGNKFFQPHFKPDFNIDLLRTVNYICHLFIVRKDVVDRIGTLRREFDGAQDYDFVFRCIEAVKSGEIYHVPKILYHWRSHEGSTSENPGSKLYAFDAGERAIQAHYDRVGIKAKVIKGEYLGLYRTKYIRGCDPLISIIIPNKDHIEDLQRCIASIEEKSTYKNYEYVIVENNSEKEETFACYKKLQAENPNVHVVYWKGTFNYSAINNFGASHAKGEYLLLLNNDTEIIDGDCLEEMLGYCMREDVGAVGARLYYEDDTVQHAGVVIGFGGIAGHCFVMQPRGDSGYCHRIICAQNYSAVTAACMMVKKKAFDKVEGLSEELQVAFNDIDFCMKLRKAGYLIVYNPYAQLYHYESKSRGLEDTPEKVARFNREIAAFEKRWPDILREGDPYYNPNLSLDSQDFSLKRIGRR